MKLERRSPEAVRGYFDGWAAACEEIACELRSALPDVSPRIMEAVGRVRRTAALAQAALEPHVAASELRCVDCGRSFEWDHRFEPPARCLRCALAPIPDREGGA